MTRRTPAMTALGIMLSISYVIALQSPRKDIPEIVFKPKQVFADIYDPTRIELDKDGNVYILSRQDHSIAVIQPSGTQARRIGRIGGRNGELYMPTDFAIAPDGTVWVADGGNDRIQHFKADGSFLGSFYVEGPADIAVPSVNEIAVVGLRDDALARLYTPQGKELRRLGESVPVELASRQEQAMLNRGRVYSLVPGQLLYHFSGLLTPAIHRLDIASGKVIQRIPVTDPALEPIINEATKRLLEGRHEGEAIRLFATLNATAVEPGTNNYWICPAGPFVLVYDSSGRKRAVLRPQRTNGQPLGAHDIVLTRAGTGYFIAGRTIFAFDLSATRF